MLISAVIPVFNREDFILDAARSVLDQTWRDLELIVVDDGSTDSTGRILAGIDDPRLRVIRQENRGVSAARNAAIAQARGELIALLDSDDLWLPEKLERQAAYMKKHGYAISQTEEIWMRGGRRVHQGKRHAKPEGMFFERSLELCLISPSCVMFNREYWEAEGPFDESLPACEDYDLWLGTCLRWPVGLVREALTVKQGGRADQLTTRVPHLDLYRIYSIIKLLKTERLADSERNAALKALESKGRVYVEGCRKRGRTEEAARVAALIREPLSGPPHPVSSRTGIKEQG